MSKIYRIRLFFIVPLLLFCLGISAQVSVSIGENGDGKFDHGTIEATGQTDPDAEGRVTVTLTVTPDDGYAIGKDDIMVFATIPPNGTRSPEIASTLPLLGDDPKNLSEQRDYTVVVSPGFGIWVKEANIHKSGAQAIESGTYRIYINKEQEKWYLWPAVTTDEAGKRYLTTYNGIEAPALDYPSKGVTYEAYGEQYSLWQVTKVETEEAIYYQLFNVGLQQYVVWSSASGVKAVHLESSPADLAHTYFRLDGAMPNLLITPSEAAEGTTLYSRHGDKPFLSASGAANAAAGYPDGEPDADGDGGLIMIYDATPTWTLESAGSHASVTFQTAGDDADEAAALFVPTTDVALPAGITAYFVTGVNLQAGVVQLQELDYLPEGTPILLVADAETTGFEILPKPEGIPVLTAEEISKNRLRVSSPAIQPAAYEDYIFFRGEFVMVSGGTLSTGKVFLDLNSEQSAATRGVIGIGGSDGTTGITAVKRQAGATESRWYSLDGRRLDGHPSRKGIYIHDGRKVVIK